jgi:MFS family permease
VELSWRWIFLVNVPIGIGAIVAGARVLREVRDDNPAIPDLLGAGVLTAAVATLIAAIVEGPDWGWADGRVVALFAVAVALSVVFARRSATHPVPVVEPALLKVRAFAASQAAGVFFFVGFSAMLLGGVLWLTEVWGETALTAGLMIAPGPATAALFSVAGGVLSGKVGPRLVGAVGALLFALGGVWWVVALGAEVHYAADYLPGMIIGGAGVGLVNPALAGAATAQLPPTRLATGSAVLTMSRQIGSALGVALLVAVLGTPSPAQAVDAFQDVWWIRILAGVAAAASFVAVGPLVHKEESVVEEIEEGLASLAPVEVVA